MLLLQLMLAMWIRKATDLDDGILSQTRSLRSAIILWTPTTTSCVKYALRDPGQRPLQAFAPQFVNSYRLQLAFVGGAAVSEASDMDYCSPSTVRPSCCNLYDLVPIGDLRTLHVNSFLTPPHSLASSDSSLPLPNILASIARRAMAPMKIAITGHSLQIVCTEGRD